MADALLVIEDEPLLGSELQDEFRGQGWDTYLATTIREARQLLLERRTYVVLNNRGPVPRDKERHGRLAKDLVRNSDDGGLLNRRNVGKPLLYLFGADSEALNLDDLFAATGHKEVTVTVLIAQITRPVAPVAQYL